MASFHADAVITNVDELHRSLHLAYKLAEEGYLVTLGIKPTAPETGYGYIRYAALLTEGFDHQAFYGERFVEKPDFATAVAYLRDGHYVCNSSIFVWRVETILAELHEHLPELEGKIDTIWRAMGTAEERGILCEMGPKM